MLLRFATDMWAARHHNAALTSQCPASYVGVDDEMVTALPKARPALSPPKAPVIGAANAPDHLPSVDNLMRHRSVAPMSGE